MMYNHTYMNNIYMLYEIFLQVKKFEVSRVASRGSNVPSHLPKEHLNSWWMIFLMFMPPNVTQSVQSLGKKTLQLTILCNRKKPFEFYYRKNKWTNSRYKPFENKGCHFTIAWEKITPSTIRKWLHILMINASEIMIFH